MSCKGCCHQQGEANKHTVLAVFILLNFNEKPVCNFSTRCLAVFHDINFAAVSQHCFPSVFLQFSSVNQQSPDIVESYEGIGISPFTHTQNYLSLTVGMLNTTHDCIFEPPARVQSASLNV